MSTTPRRAARTRLGTAADGHQFLVGHPGGKAGQSIAKNDSGESGAASRYWAQNCSLSARLRILTPRRCRLWMLPMVSSRAAPAASNCWRWVSGSLPASSWTLGRLVPT